MKDSITRIEPKTLPIRPEVRLLCVIADARIPAGLDALSSVLPWQGEKGLRELREQAVVRPLVLASVKADYGPDPELLGYLSREGDPLSTPVIFQASPDDFEQQLQKAARRLRLLCGNRGPRWYLGGLDDIAHKKAIEFIRNLPVIGGDV